MKNRNKNKYVTQYVLSLISLCGGSSSSMRSTIFFNSNRLLWTNIIIVSSDRHFHESNKRWNALMTLIKGPFQSRSEHILDINTIFCSIKHKFLYKKKRPVCKYCFVIRNYEFNWRFYWVTSRMLKNVELICTIPLRLLQVIQ